MKNFDAVMVTHAKNAKIARISIKYLIKNAFPDKIYLICAKNIFTEFDRLSPNLILVDEDSVVPNITFSKMDELIKAIDPRNTRVGWYFQQFLKMGICAREDLAGHYLIWDSDTVLLKPLSFFTHDGRVLFTKYAECHPPYFETLRAILGEKRNCDFSFIVEHMMVNKLMMREMIEKIHQGSLKTGEWVPKIIKSVDPKDIGLSGFSEYETYGNYVYNRHRETAEFRRIPTFRKGSAIFGRYPNYFDCARLARQYVYASFESRRWASKNRRRFEKVKSFFIWLFNLPSFITILFRKRIEEAS